jgi:hypothetical protein
MPFLEGWDYEGMPLLKEVGPIRMDSGIIE